MGASADEFRVYVGWDTSDRQPEPTQLCVTVASTFNMDSIDKFGELPILSAWLRESRYGGICNCSQCRVVPMLQRVLTVASRTACPYTYTNPMLLENGIEGNCMFCIAPFDLLEHKPRNYCPVNPKHIVCNQCYLSQPFRNMLQISARCHKCTSEIGTLRIHDDSAMILGLLILQEGKYTV